MTDDLHRQLHQHAAALRGLARDLLRDGHAAEDVAQTTLQQALARRDLQPGPLGGWLQRTLVNFVRQWRRGERRRARRETSLPPREPAPATAELLARREMLQRVTDAVLGLDEPYQTAVFLRYFEDLPPRTIARRTGANLATVKSRLARGLGLLRARLDRGDRDGHLWRPALAFAFGLPTALLAPLPAGALLVTATPKVLFAVGAVCVGGWFVLGADEPAAPTVRAADASHPVDPSIALTAPADAAGNRSERTAAAMSAVANDAWLVHPHTVELEVRVVDRFGLPIEGHTLRLGPIGCASNQANASTDADGRVLLTWPTRQPQVTMDLADARGQLRRFTLRADRRTHLTVLGETTGNESVHLSYTAAIGALRQAEAVTTGKVTGSDGVPVLGGVPVLSTLFRSGGGKPTMRSGLHPAAMFGDDCARILEAPVATSEIAISRLHFLGRDAVIAMSFQFEDGGAGKLTWATARTIAGTVFGSDGKPAAKVPVVLLGAGPQPLERSQTGDDGTFEFTNMAEGEFTVRAGGDQHGLATTTATVTTGTTPTTLHLQTGLCVRGRALGLDGAPLANALVEWCALDGSWTDVTTVRDDGTFVLANLPGGPGQVLLLPPDGPRRLPLAIVASVLPDAGELELRGDLSGGTLRVEPILTAEEPRPQFHVWQPETGRGAAMAEPEHGAVWSMAQLPAGFYDVEVRVPGGGVRPLGRHWLDGKTPVDLGRVAVPRAGELHVTADDDVLPLAADERAFEIVAVRADVDVRAELATMPLGEPIQLPAGDYALLFRHRDGTVRAQRFTVRAEQRTALQLGG